MRGVKRIAAALLAALLVLSLAACGPQKTGLRLYYPADLSAKHKSVGGSDAITSVLVNWKKVTGDDRGRQQQAQYIMELLLGGCTIAAIASGALACSFYPRYALPSPNTLGCVAYACYTILALFPALLEVEERIRWKSLKLKI